MPAGYARVPNPASAHNDIEGELEAAFELNDEDDNETSPLTNRPGGNRPSQALSIQTKNANAGQSPNANTGGYDFERQDYDFPPPGSPPAPTSRALPNDIGNSNGIVPLSPVAPHPPRPSFFRRAVGAVGGLLPTHYSRVATSEPSRAVGGGTDNDGVFANVMAKPQVGKVVRTEDGNVYVVPEDSQKEMPPTYAEAQADAVPPYWETTIHAPATLDPNADMIIEDLPTGTFIVFAMNFIISWFFQFVGFFLTYMLHTSHAAKFGSRAGLGLTLIQYGFYSRVINQDQEDAQSAGDYPSTSWSVPVNSTLDGGLQNADNSNYVNPQEIPRLSQTSRDWMSFLFMTLGWFLLLSSCVGYWRVKRWESSLRTPPADPTSPEEIERDQDIRRRIHNVFGIAVEDDVPVPAVPLNANELTPQQQAALAAEIRLTRDLRAAGLI